MSNDNRQEVEHFAVQAREEHAVHEREAEEIDRLFEQALAAQERDEPAIQPDPTAGIGDEAHLARLEAERDRLVEEIRSWEQAGDQLTRLAVEGGEFVINPQLEGIIQHGNRLAQTITNPEPLQEALNNVMRVRQDYVTHAAALLPELRAHEVPAIRDRVSRLRPVFVSGGEPPQIPDPIPVRANEMRPGIDFGGGIYRTIGSFSRVEVGYSRAVDAGGDGRAFHFPPNRGSLGVTLKSGLIERPQGWGVFTRLRGRFSKSVSATMEKGLRRDGGIYSTESIQFHDVLPHCNLAVGAVAEETSLWKFALFANEKSNFFLSPTVNGTTPPLVPFAATEVTGEFLIPLQLKKATPPVTPADIEEEFFENEEDLDQDLSLSEKEEAATNDLREEPTAVVPRIKIPNAIPGVNLVLPSPTPASTMRQLLPATGTGRAVLGGVLMLSALAAGIWFRRNKKTDA